MLASGARSKIGTPDEQPVVGYGDATCERTEGQSRLSEHEIAALRIAIRDLVGDRDDVVSTSRIERPPAAQLKLAIHTNDLAVLAGRGRLIMEHQQNGLTVAENRVDMPVIW